MDGDVDEGYGKVADAFRRNFSSGREIGAAVAVYRDGRKVVDLWGGFRNGHTQAPWQTDTIVNVFSTTKGIASLAVAVAASRGLIDYDAAVADYWPEFAQAGKGAVTVRQLLGHQAGLVAIKPPLTLSDIADPEKLSAKIARQPPAWPPGTRHGYHAVDARLVRIRTHPPRRPAGTHARPVLRRGDRGAARLGHLHRPAGLGGSQPRGTSCAVSRRQMLLHLHTMPPLFVAALFNPSSLTARAFVVATGIKAAGDFNRDDVRILSKCRPSTALPPPRRSPNCTAMPQPEVRTGIESSPSATRWRAPPCPPTKGLRDKVMQLDTSYSLGFGKPTSRFMFGSSDRAFGWPGAGGSFGFADPDTGIGFGYVMNRMGYHSFSDPRELTLRQAVP